MWLDAEVLRLVAGVVAVLVYRIPWRWRSGYALVVLVVYGVPLVTGRTFTDLGHFASVLIGFGCYPLVRGRSEPRNPKETAAALRG